MAYLRRTVLTSVLCTSHRTDTEGSTFASSVSDNQAVVSIQSENPGHTLLPFFAT